MVGHDFLARHQLRLAVFAPHDGRRPPILNRMLIIAETEIAPDGLDLCTQHRFAKRRSVAEFSAVLLQGRGNGEGGVIALAGIDAGRATVFLRILGDEQFVRRILEVAIPVGRDIDAERRVADRRQDMGIEGLRRDNQWYRGLEPGLLILTNERDSNPPG